VPAPAGAGAAATRPIGNGARRGAGVESRGDGGDTDRDERVYGRGMAVDGATGGEELEHKQECLCHPRFSCSQRALHPPALMLRTR